VKSYNCRIEDFSEDFITSFDVVLGCLDNIMARFHVNAHCYYNNIPYIDSGTKGLIGKVQVILPPKTSCFECGMNKTHNKIKEINFSCTGRDVTIFRQKIAAEINTTSIVSAIQVQELLKILHKRWNKIIKNIFYFDGNQNVFNILELPINPECPHHQS
jgi:molybdopterin/thiamine biosynthesis adenylyltransferase